MNSAFFFVVTMLVAAAFAQPTGSPPVCDPEPQCYYPMVFDAYNCKCNCTYHPSSVASKYEIHLDGFPMPIVMSCPGNLVWSQDQCLCEENENIVPVNQDPIPTVGCVTLVDLTSNGTDFSNQVNYYQEIEKLKAIVVEDVVGATSGKAANFQGISLYLPVLEYNDLTDTAMMKLRVKPFIGAHVYDDNDQVIISDACLKNSTPAIELKYNPNMNNFTLTLTSSTNDKQMCENVTASADGWFTINISTQDGSTSWTINDVQCPQLLGTGNIMKTACGLTVGGNPVSTNDSEDFYGHIDYVKMIKHCANEDSLP